MHPIYTGARRYPCLFPKVHFVYFSRYTSDLESSIRFFFLDIFIFAFPHPIHAVQNHFARTVPQEVRYVVIVWPVRSCHCVVLEKVFWYMSGRNISMRMVITSESAICFCRGRYLYFKSLFWASTLMFVSTAAWYVASIGSCPPLQKGKHYNRNSRFEFQLSSVLTSSCAEVSYINSLKMEL